MVGLALQWQSGGSHGAVVGGTAPVSFSRAVREQLGLGGEYLGGPVDPSVSDGVEAAAAGAALAPASDPAPAPVLDPFDDADALEELEEEITVLAAHIHAATHRLLTLIAEFDRRRGWQLGGHRSCAHWLVARTGLDLATAREKVRTARALVGLPQTGASMARGELSFSQVRALTRVATESNEGELLRLARGTTTAQLERTVRAFRRGKDREEEVERARRLWERRRLSVFPDEEGMYLVRGRLPAEVGALLMRAVEAASDALWRRRGTGWLETEEERAEAAAQLRADALGLLAERALAAGFGGGEEARDGEGAREGRGAKNGARAKNVSGETSRDQAPAPIPLSGTRAERYQVLLHVDLETLRVEGPARGSGPRADGENERGTGEENSGGSDGSAGTDCTAFSSRSEMEDGTRVSFETSRRLACDAAVVEVLHDDAGAILDVGRRRRTVPPAIRRALEARDRGCRFPGCGLRFTDAHHIRHWADGGETSLKNCLLLCSYHHHLLHEGGWTVDWWGEGRPVFFSPRGGVHFDGGWESPELEEADPVAVLVDANRRLQGTKPDAWTAGARWEREADIPDDVYYGVMEALSEDTG